MRHCFVFEVYGAPRDLHVLTHSFPTRRSSDLSAHRSAPAPGRPSTRPAVRDRSPAGESSRSDRLEAAPADRRSEEHTPELQSLMRNSYAGFCLKKKKSNCTIIV